MEHLEFNSLKSSLSFEAASKPLSKITLFNYPPNANFTFESTGGLRKALSESKHLSQKDMINKRYEWLLFMIPGKCSNCDLKKRLS